MQLTLEKNKEETTYKLIKGECLEEMDKMISQGLQVDLILCDPPYGTIKGLDRPKRGELGLELVAVDADWDVAIDPVDIFNRAVKLLKPAGRLILFSQEPYTTRLRSGKYPGFKFNYPLIWEKNKFGNPLTARKAPLSYFEDINVFVRSSKADYSHVKYTPLRDYARKVLEFIGKTPSEVSKDMGNNKASHFLRADATQFSIPTESTYEELTNRYGLRFMKDYREYSDISAEFGKLLMNRKKTKQTFNLNGRGHVSNIFKYAKEPRETSVHPTQKPVALMEDLIETYSNPGETVLDFTMGSGSTGVAAVKTGRKFIGIELDDEYYETAKNRVTEAIEGL